jgi:uncharacterized protein (TIGR02145 family)
MITVWMLLLLIGNICKMKKILLYAGFIAWPMLSNAQTVTDIDSNVYNTVTIGTQTWIVENLKTIRYNDSVAIQKVTNDTAWGNLSTGAYCTYKNTMDTDTINTYGRLYNWYAVETGKICPVGWHVPTNAEWTTLENYLIANGYNYDGSTTGNRIAKSLASDFGWSLSTNTGAVGCNDYPEKRNVSGFSALPGGDRGIDGSFSLFSYFGYWWCATGGDPSSAWGRCMIYDSSNVLDYYCGRKVGFSVRCVNDISTSVNHAINSDRMYIYPNPANDMLYLKNSNYTNSLIMIYDTHGKLVLSKKMDTNPVNIINLRKGIYLIRLIGPGVVLNSKFIKE